MNLRTTPITFLVCLALLIGIVLGASTASVSSSLLLFPSFVIDHGEIWRLITYPLVPGSLLHFLIATAVLLWLGRRLELRIGRWRYLILCLLPSVIAGVVYLILPGPTDAKLPLASAHFMSCGIALAAIAFSFATRSVRVRSVKTWIIGLGVGYYLYALLVGPHDILIMNIVVILVSGALVFRQVRDVRAA